MDTTADILAWLLQTTVKKVGKMRISQLQAAWLAAKLPPASIMMTDKQGERHLLFDLGEVAKPKKARKKS